MPTHDPRPPITDGMDACPRCNRLLEYAALRSHVCTAPQPKPLPSSATCSVCNGPLAPDGTCLRFACSVP